jgi:hypothetical protein
MDAPSPPLAVFEVRATNIVVAASMLLLCGCDTGFYDFHFVEGVFGPGPPMESGGLCIGWDFETEVPCEAFEVASAMGAGIGLQEAQSALDEFRDSLVEPAPTILVKVKDDEGGSAYLPWGDTASDAIIDDQAGEGIALDYTAVEGMTASWPMRQFRWCSESGAPTQRTLELAFFDTKSLSGEPYTTAVVDTADFGAGGTVYIGDQTSSSVILLTAGCFYRGGL